MDQVVAGTRSRQLSVGRNGVYACDAARSGRRSHVCAFPGHGWLRLADLTRLFATRGLLRNSVHDYNDRDKAFVSSSRLRAIQHVLSARTWVFSFRALARTTIDKGGQAMPFFMLPSLGGSSGLRGYSSLRFRDRNSLLLQGEWRIMASRFLDSAVFYDAGKMTARASDLDFDGLKHDYGFGLRFHGPISTPLRIELARGTDGLTLVVATSAIF